MSIRVIRLFILTEFGKIFQRTTNIDQVAAALKHSNDMQVSCVDLMLDSESPVELNKVFMVQWYDTDKSVYEQCYLGSFERAVVCYRSQSAHDYLSDLSFETLFLS